MGRRNRIHVTYQESGGGWGNPLLGRVFDSDSDLSEEERIALQHLLQSCKLSKQDPENESARDAPAFELCVESGGETFTITGDRVSADEKLRPLLDFVRRRSRKELLK